VLDALDGAGREPTLQAVGELWDVPDLRASARTVQDGDARQRLVDYCERLPRAQLEHIASLRARIDEVTDTAAGESLRSAADPADELDLRVALERGSIVVLSINADSYPGAAATIGNLALQDLIGAVGELRQKRRRVRAVVAVDEFDALSGEHLGRLLSTARDVGVAAIVAGQDLAQMRRVSPHFEAVIKANVSAVIAHRQSEPDSAEEIARMCGTEEVVLETHQIDRRRGPRPTGDGIHATGVGTRHLERDFRIGPDRIKDLDNGEAVIRLYNPAGAELARIHRCESTEGSRGSPGHGTRTASGMRSRSASCSGARNWREGGSGGDALMTGSGKDTILVCTQVEPESRRPRHGRVPRTGAPPGRAALQAEPEAGRADLGLQRLSRSARRKPRPRGHLARGVHAA
jgi:hypothetical protein